MTERPVVGIAQASMYLAAMVAHKFSIITLTARTIAPLEALIQAYGMQQSVASIRATAMSVLDYVRDPVAGMKALAEQSRLAIEQDGAEAVCLGCAGMVSFTQQLEQELQVPVFDGVIAAVKIAEGLAFLGKKTSKICSYAWPSPDSLKGFEPSTEGGYLIR